jgi:hypothetical protein
MKLLKNESQFRIWIFEDFFGSDDIKNILNDSELEDEIKALMPDSFPCLAYITSGNTIFEPGCPKFVSCKQVNDWASEMSKVELSH